ncbi:MAG: hypothetical protein K0R33_3668 [Mycobacterium sp.]|jgi:uncharacterized protein (TIGR04222 family)|nr:hypothetical protein [Mycobacterium sp.]
MSLERILDVYLGSISGWMYVVVAALVVSTAFAVVWRFLAPEPPTPLTEGIRATELAYLRSDAAAVVTALAALRASGRIMADGRVDPRVPRGPESDWFTERVWRRVADDPAHTVRTLIAACRADLPVLEQRLCERGLIRPAAERARIRWGAVPALVTAVAGGALCVYTITQHPARFNTGAILLLTVVLTPFAVAVLPSLFSVDRRTRAGRRLLRAQQKQQDFLKPARRPAFATYGAGAVAMSTALFGTAALWSVDPDYATSVELNGDADGGGDGASCGGCGGGGGGAGCGGCGGGGGGGGE